MRISAWSSDICSSDLLHIGEIGIVANARGKVFAREAGHHLIEEGNVIWMTGMPCPFQLGLRGKTIFGSGDGNAIGAQLRGQDVEVHWNVIDDQHFELLEIDRKAAEIGQVGGRAYKG